MYRLRIASGPRRGECFVLPDGPAAPGPVRIGRGHEVEVRIPEDGTLSRLQAELRLEPGGWALHNRSQHGTHVGRRKVDDRRLLTPGDVLVLGETQVVFERVGPAPTGPSGMDSLTPATPSVAAPSDDAGFDSQGVFHMGHTLLGPGADEVEGSFIYFGRTEHSPGVRVKARRLYFFLVVAVLGGAGCLSTGLLIVLPTLLAHPGQLLQATAFGLLPAIPYVLLIKLLDRNGQIPWKNYLACVAWGGTVGCGFSLVLNAIGGSMVNMVVGASSPEGAFATTAVLVAPVVEEVVKGLAVLFVFWLLHDEFDNVVEGMVLGAASGLGFALVENSIYNIHFLAQDDGGTSTLLAMGTYRALVNALIGHPVYTAMTGAGLGLLRETRRGGPWRLLLPVGGLLLAIGLHLVWNGAAVFLGRALGPENTPLVLLINAVVFGGAGLGFFVAAYLFAQARERRVLLTYLGEEVERGFIFPDELESFRRLFGRQRYELAGLVEGGPAVFAVRRALRRAQVELAFRKWHLAKGDAPRGQLVDAYVLSARTRIRDARNRLRELEGRARRGGDDPPTVQPGAS
ncbi:MAG: PrsW family intramembrane metalloprotease [Planctomycetes bacterium]|nr:PrsW family intramembrane metalloprotease [Labilithrix sp.]MBX3470152.1 PrsW family intramembrane metalloprotease [Planctomycetota bacterium]